MTNKQLIEQLLNVPVKKLLSFHQLERLVLLTQTDEYTALDTLSNWVQAMNNDDVPNELQAVYDRVCDMEKQDI